MKKVLGCLINEDQVGFVNGRYIGEAVRTVIDTIEYAKKKDKRGLIFLIDFRKAFDSLSHAFVEKTLDFFNFGTKFKRWIKLLLHDFWGQINHGGNLSALFAMERGARQGDPISSLIFILCIEILAMRLRSSKKIVG